MISYCLDLLRQSGKNNFTKLIEAVRVNNIEKVRQLIKDAKLLGIAKKTVNIPNKKGQSPLWSASLRGYTKVVSLLLDNGADVNQSSNKGATPLFIASQKNHLPVVIELVSRGADVNQSMNDGASPAYIAAQKGNIEVLNFLISKEIDVGQKSYQNFTLLHIAASKNHHSIVEMLLKEPKIRNLIDDISNKFNHTPLTVAVYSDGDLEMMRLLINNGADKDKAGHQNKTPLEWARVKEKTDIVKYLQSL